MTPAARDRASPPMGCVIDNPLPVTRTVFCTESTYMASLSSPYGRVDDEASAQLDRGRPRPTQLGRARREAAPVRRQHNQRMSGRQPWPRWVLDRSIARQQSSRRVLPLKQEVEVAGLRIAYRAYGARDPVIFLHGFFGDSRVWRRQFELADRYRVIAWDAPGCGGSAQPRQILRGVSCSWAPTPDGVAPFRRTSLQRGWRTASKTSSFRARRL